MVGNYTAHETTVEKEFSSSIVDGIAASSYNRMILNFKIYPLVYFASTIVCSGLGLVYISKRGCFINLLQTRLCIFFTILHYKESHRIG